MEGIILVEEGKACSYIAVPPGEVFRDLASQIQDAVREASGCEIPVLEVGAGCGAEDGVPILLGNATNNPLMRRIRFECFDGPRADADWPGPGGYECLTGRTLRGEAFVSFGSSDEDGLRTAVSGFCDSLAQARSHTLCLKPSVHNVRYENVRPLRMNTNLAYNFPGSHRWSLEATNLKMQCPHLEVGQATVTMICCGDSGTDRQGSVVHCQACGGYTCVFHVDDRDCMSFGIRVDRLLGKSEAFANASNIASMSGFDLEV